MAISGQVRMLLMTVAIILLVVDVQLPLVGCCLVAS